MSPNSLTTLLMEMTVALGADENAVENEVDELRTFIREHHKVTHLSHLNNVYYNMQMFVFH